MLSEINVITKSLQTTGRSLSEMSADLEILIEGVIEGRTITCTELLGCKLSTKYIGKDGLIVHSKISRAEWWKIKEEKMKNYHMLSWTLCIALKRNYSSTNNVTGTGNSTIKENLSKKRKKGCPESRYIDFRFVLGSTAESERLLSVGELLFVPGRRDISPQLLEALLFLKENLDFRMLNLCESINGSLRTHALVNIWADAQNAQEWDASKNRYFWKSQVLQYILLWKR